MEDNRENNTQKIREAINALLTCDTITLTAVLAMLPDYTDEGTSAILSAAARVIAERFRDVPATLEQFAKIVRENERILKENNP